MTNKWKIEYKNEPWFTIHNGETRFMNGYFCITFNGMMYGTMGREALDQMQTGEITMLIERMLNDAHDLALKHKD